ncbi:MAG: VWA domain-containing protein [Chitinophagaceae bacterium]
MFGWSSYGQSHASNIVFLLDISNSMGKDHKMELLQKSTEELCKVLNAKDRVSLLTFGTVVETLYSSSSFSGSDSLLRTLKKVRSTAAATNINRGIYDAIEQSDKMKLPEENHVFLVTDGEFALNPFTKSLVEKRKDIRLTCVIVGKGPSAEKAVKYVTEELKLKVITLVNEEADVKKLAELVKSTVIDIQ